MQVLVYLYLFIYMKNNYTFLSWSDNQILILKRRLILICGFSRTEDSSALKPILRLSDVEVDHVGVLPHVALVLPPVHRGVFVIIGLLSSPSPLSSPRSPPLILAHQHHGHDHHCQLSSKSAFSSSPVFYLLLNSLAVFITKAVNRKETYKKLSNIVDTGAPNFT